MHQAKPTIAFTLLAAFCAAAAGYAGLVESGHAACAASRPTLEARPAQAAPSEPLNLHGEGFFGDFICDDTGPPILSRPTGGRPTDGIRVELLQGTKTWTLATVASDKNLRFDAKGLTVPADAAPGEAVVRATSPSIFPEASPSPPQADTPFLVLDALPNTGGPKHSPVGRNG